MIPATIYRSPPVAHGYAAGWVCLGLLPACRVEQGLAQAVLVIYTSDQGNFPGEHVGIIKCYMAPDKRAG